MVGAFAAQLLQGFSYDAAGNLLADGIWTYQYDALNRLRVMERVDTILGVPTDQDVRLEFAYDEQNRRVEKTVKNRTSGTVRSRERFLYEGWNLVATLKVEGEGSAQSASLASRYVWRTTNAQTGAFGLLMVAGDHDGSSVTAPQAYYPGYDGKGNLTVLADTLQGVAAAASEYSPFGERQREEASARLPDLKALGAHFGFATQYTDAESGLVYFGHRYYSPTLGRFLSKDPLGEAGSINRYSYASNNPINLTDYRGLCDGGFSDDGGWFGDFLGDILDRLGRMFGRDDDEDLGEVYEMPHDGVIGTWTEEDEAEYQRNKMDDAFDEFFDNHLNDGWEQLVDGLDDYESEDDREPVDGEYPAQGTQRNGSVLGNELARVPILGGLGLGTIGDALSGVGNILTGNFSRGLGQIGYGVYDFANIMVNDAFDFAYGMTIRKAMALSRLPAIFREYGTADGWRALASILIVPHYGKAGGAAHGPDRYIGVSVNIYDSFVPITDVASYAQDEASADMH